MGIMKWLFGKKEYKSSLTTDQQKEVDEQILDNTIELQAQEDRKWDRKIQEEAIRMFEEWKQTTPVQIGEKQYRPYIPLVNLPVVYLVYNQYTKKYNGSEAHQKVMEIYNDLISQEYPCSSDTTSTD